MQNTVKFTLIFLISIFSFHTRANSFAIKGGYNLSKMVDSGSPYSYSGYDVSTMSGGHIGIATDIDLISFLSIEPGLLFTTKGAKYKFQRMGSSYDGKKIFYTSKSL